MSDKFTKYDDPTFTSSFVHEAASNQCEAQLNVHGLHCYSCVALIEKSIAAKSAQAQVNLTNKTAKLIYNPSHTKLSELVQLIHELGFEVMTTKKKSSGLGSDLIAMGVSLFTASNLMMLALAEYFDVTHEIDARFAWFLHKIAWILGTVCLVVGGRKILHTAWTSLRLKSIHIDQPIAFGLLVTYGYSTYQTFWGDGHIYFDSLAAIIAFLMVGRYAQNRLIDRAMRTMANTGEEESDLVQRIQGTQTDYVTVQDIKPQDNLLLPTGALVPLACKLLSSAGEVYEEPLTGEIKVRQILAGETIVAGLAVGSQPLIVEALELGSQSRWYIAKKDSQALILSEKGTYQGFADKVAVVFFITLVSFALGNLLLRTLWLQQDFASVMAITISMLLVACPCAFGLANVLIFSVIAARAFKKGIVFRNQRALEALVDAKIFYFDKTGTLTTGKPCLSVAMQAPECSIYANLIDQSIAYASMHSTHFLLQALREYHKNLATADLSEPILFYGFHEYFSQGVEFFYEKKQVRIGNINFVLDDMHLSSTLGS